MSWADSVSETTYRDDQQRGFFRFVMNVPPGASIVTSSLRVKCARTSESDVVRLKISGLDFDDAAAPTDYASAQVTSRTTANVDWVISSQWSVDEFYYSPELSAILNEITGRAGWAYGNHIVVYLEENGSDIGASRAIYSFDSDPADAAVLEYYASTSGYLAYPYVGDQIQSPTDSITVYVGHAYEVQVGDSMPASTDGAARYLPISIHVGDSVAAWSDAASGLFRHFASVTDDNKTSGVLNLQDGELRLVGDYAATFDEPSSLPNWLDAAASQLYAGLSPIAKSVLDPVSLALWTDEVGSFSTQVMQLGDEISTLTDSGGVTVVLEKSILPTGDNLSAWVDNSSVTEALLVVPPIDRITFIIAGDQWIDTIVGILSHLAGLDEALLDWLDLVGTTYSGMEGKQFLVADPVSLDAWSDGASVRIFCAVQAADTLTAAADGATAWMSESSSVGDATLPSWTDGASIMQALFLAQSDAVTLAQWQDLLSEFLGYRASVEDGVFAWFDLVNKTYAGMEDKQCLVTDEFLPVLYDSIRSNFDRGVSEESRLVVGTMIVVGSQGPSLGGMG